MLDIARVCVALALLAGLAVHVGAAPAANLLPVAAAGPNFVVDQPPRDAGGFSPAAFMGVLFIVTTFLILVGAGIVLGVAALAAALALAVVGIVSGAAAVGILRRSAGDGVRALVIGLGVAGGAVSGVILCVIAELISPGHLSFPVGAMLGAGGGAAAGLVVALLLNVAWTRLLNWGLLKVQSWRERRWRGGGAGSQ